MNKSLIFILLICCLGCTSKRSPEISLYTVKKGDLSINLTEEGELKASRSMNISSPAISWRFGNLKIVKIVEDGKEVIKGDTVIIFDPSEVGKAIEQSKNELAIAHAQLTKTKAEQASKLEDLESSYKITEISHRISEINFGLAEYEADVTKKEIKLKLKKAKIGLSKAKAEISNTKKIQHEELQQAQLRIKQLEAKLQEGHDALKSLTIISPSSGIAILTKNWSTGNKWQVGDQTWTGNPMITLPDLSQIKAIVKINEVDISKIRSSQEAKVRLDAYSDTVFSAHITSIANLAERKSGKNKIKVFPVEILIHGTSPKLLPGMTVSCNIMIDKIKDGLIIPSMALFSKGNEHWVFLKRGSSFKKQAITIGPSNEDYLIVKKGLEKGDKIALTDPFLKKEESKKEE